MATAVAVLLAAQVLVFGPAAHSEPTTPCVLVLSAMPSELGPLLDATAMAGRPRPVDVDGHRFFTGRLRGHDVVLGLTGIGLVNAERTTRAALRGFGCIGGVVFSGVAGGTHIGDVAVPDRWTEDGTHVTPVDSSMRRAAARAAESGRVTLESTTPIGDPACVCDLSALVRPGLTVQFPPAMVLGGTGHSADPFAGQRLPCVPGGGDVFGCDPCGHLRPAPPDAAALLALVTSDFISSYAANPPTVPAGYVVEDMETARTAAVVAEHGLPFIGFRGVSDGAGDPLGLPGFPAQFFVYRQLAADNAAAVTIAFLDQWGPPA